MSVSTFLDTLVRNMNRRRNLLVGVLLLVFQSSIHAAPKSTKLLNGFVDLNFYPFLTDVKTDNVITINAANRFGNRFSYFSLSNFGSQHNSGSFSDIDTFYTEQNLRWQISKTAPLDLTIQSNIRSGVDNDRHRLGIRWRLNNTAFLASYFQKLNLSYSVNLHALQFDHEPGSVWQLEHAFRINFPRLSEGLYVAGFVDHTFNQSLTESLPDSPIVAEVQVGYGVTSRLFLIAEYRINEYRRSDMNNLAVGFEYRIGD